MTRWTLHHADCLDAMRAMDEASIDAIVTDPPYGLSFMDREWDHGVPGVSFWAEALRVAKPGAHLVAFGGTRTYHRLACAIEDAGWEVRDCLSWLYGSGFPKSLDVSKAIDKAAGAERAVVGPNAWAARGGLVRANAYGVPSRPDETAPATDAARQWEGWGTALKPAWEPIILARKPLVGTVAANVLAHGTGAINVDGCRIKWRDETDVAAAAAATGYETARARKTIVQSASIGKESRDGTEHYNPHALAGRWPANVALGCACEVKHDEDCAVALLDAQTGMLTSGNLLPKHRLKASKNVAMSGANQARSPRLAFGGDSGGASRFFYTAKASRSERGSGNTHPTVKPVAIMRWLVRMVTPPGGVVLDPFNGSGTTGVAALAEGMRYVGCEREAEYVEIARRRLAMPWEDDDDDAPEAPAVTGSPMQLELWR